ncbi:putative MHC class I antigen protein, partial [Naja naja]
RNVKMTTKLHQVSELPSFHVISNLEQGPEAPLVESGMCVCMCYLPLHAKNQAGENGPPYHYSQAVLGSGVLKEKLLGQGNPEEDEKTRLGATRLFSSPLAVETPSIKREE